MVLSYPVSRARVLVEKGAALLVGGGADGGLGAPGDHRRRPVVRPRHPARRGSWPSACRSPCWARVFGMLALAVGRGVRLEGHGHRDRRRRGRRHLPRQLAGAGRVVACEPLRWALAVLVRHGQQPAGQRARRPGRGRARGRVRGGALGGRRCWRSTGATSRRALGRRPPRSRVGLGARRRSCDEGRLQLGQAPRAARGRRRRGEARARRAPPAMASMARLASSKWGGSWLRWMLASS